MEQASTFNAVLWHLNEASAPIGTRSGLLRQQSHHESFEDSYARHRQNVVASHPEFSALGLKAFDDRLRTLHKRMMFAGTRGLKESRVEAVLGISVATFRAYLEHFRLTDEFALLYLGNREIVMWPFKFSTRDRQ